MKIKPEHYGRLKQALDKALVGFGSEQKADYFKHNPKATESRFMWDAFWFAQRHDERLLNDLYTYLNDSHIGTALKNYFK
jgi:hypothetical protein